MNEIAPVNSTALMSFIERAAINPDFDVQKFGELLRMQREMEHDQARKMFNRAMAETQAEMQSVVRNAKNSHLNSKYAKLETIDAAMRPVYTMHGFSVRFGSAPAPHEGWMRITCTVAHDGGYFEENYLDSPVTTTGSQGGRMAMTPVQAIGSTVTYLRRYLLSMVMNVVLADDDDDGEGMRSQPAATPRYQRKVDPTPYDAAPDPRWDNPTTEKPQPTDEQWEVWVAKLRAACAVLKHRQEVVEIGGKDSVRDAIRDAPDRFKRDISAILAEAFERFPAEPGDDLDEVVIAGEEKVGAG